MIVLEAKIKKYSQLLQRKSELISDVSDVRIKNKSTWSKNIERLNGLI